MVHRPETSREWFFGSIPNDWQALPVKYLCAHFSQYGANLPAENYHDDGVRFLRTTDIREDGTLIDRGVFVPSDVVKDYILENGDFLISRSGTIGRSYVHEVKNGPCAFAAYLVRYVLRELVTSRWLFYITKTPGFQHWLGSVAIEATIGNVNAEKYANFLIPLPPLPQQIILTNYLNRETARIDALIAAKEQILSLLAEKRREIIISVITRGLDPNVTLRDSGIPWFGKIPAHWETPPVYSRFEVQLGKMLDEKRIKGTHLAPYLRNIDVQWGEINTSDLPEMDFDEEDRRRYSLRIGDILICEGGEIGRCAIWKDAHIECYYQKALHRVRPLGDKDLPEFFVHVMRAIVGAGVFSSQAAAATIQHLPAEKLRIFRYPAPPIKEQHEIIEFISRKTGKIDGVLNTMEKTISLLKERRSALIAAAVTGQIKVGCVA